MAQLNTGALIAGYRVDGLAGRGGMGVVYRATQLSLGRTVALKLIAPTLAGDAHFRERFERESRLAAAIDHPNVLPVYEAGEADGTLFIAMRWVEGTDLRTLIRRGPGIPPRRAVRIIGQIAAGLDAAHHLGLVHRDVKPANILIPNGTEHAYLTDFGLMKRIRGGDELTDSGEFIGTIDYIAPEQIRGDGCDARSDVYSLGCVLFHSLAGRVPFDSGTGVTKIYAHLHEEPPRPSEVVPDLQPALDDVAACAMAKEPAARYQTAADFARAAAAATEQAPPPGLGEETGTAPAETALLRDGARPGRRHRSRRRIGAAAGLGLLVLAGATVALVALGGSGEQHQKPAHAATPPSFEDETFLRAPHGTKIWIVKAGARFAVPMQERAGFGFRAEDVRTVSRATLRRVPLIPRDGSLIKAYRSTPVWRITGGTRQLAHPAPGADTKKVPSTGLAQIPVLPGGRITHVTLKAPQFVVEHRRFVLQARVRSTSGIPTGLCVFYRIDPLPRKERGDTPVQNGRCAVRLKYSGSTEVRYSVHFIGDPGWRASLDATPPIQVLFG
jgi:hypothetical protein